MRRLVALFSPRGRMGRLDWVLLGMLPIVWLPVALYAPKLFETPGLSLGWVLFNLTSLSVRWVTTIRRLHDLGRRAIWSFPVLLYEAGLWFFDIVLEGAPHETAQLIAILPYAPYQLWLLIVRGQPGENRYGPPPGYLLRDLFRAEPKAAAPPG